MNFVSSAFVLFLLIVFVLYWCLPRKPQNILLWAASYFFYGWWDWRFLGLIVTSTLVDFLCGLLLGKVISTRRRKAILCTSLITNLGLLAVFKYYGFFVGSLAAFCEAWGFEPPLPMLHVVLPVGISFYTFQTISYTVDVYRGQLAPTRSLVDFSVYVSLFPQLVAGPIERGTHLLPQVAEPRRFDAAQFQDGIMLIMTGYFRKVVIADNMAILVNAVFARDASELSAAGLLLGVYAFAWQIYGDFSGYSDIARGTAKLLGIELMVNFRQPYFAIGPSDFWRRWHISLSSWLRDYLYIPLGGSRGSSLATYKNLLLVMLLGGLWHGAAWAFVFWGAIHGLWLAIDRLVTRRRHRTPDHPDARPVRWAKTIGTFHLVCLGWLFFRADTVAHGFSMMQAFSNWSVSPEMWSGLTMLVLFAVPLYLIDVRCKRRNEQYPFEHGPYWMRLALCCCIVVSLVTLGSGDANAFIYFQF